MRILRRWRLYIGRRRKRVSFISDGEITTLEYEETESTSFTTYLTDLAD